MTFTPIPPVPGRVWPPAHCWMDEHGNWWEAPGKLLTIPGVISQGETKFLDQLTTMAANATEQDLKAGIERLEKFAKGLAP